MIKNKHYSLLLLLSLMIMNTNTMELPSQTAETSWLSSPWITKGLAIIGGVLLGTIAIKMLLQQPPETFELFEELPPEMQYYIINLITIEAQATNLKEAARAINALSQVNKELNFIINDPKYFFKLIKSLAIRFNTIEENVCKKLQTMAAKEYLRVNGSPSFLAGITPLIEAIWDGNDKKIYELLQNKYLSINKQTIDGGTALLAALHKLAYIYRTIPAGEERDKEVTKLISYIQDFLIYHTADPELANFSGTTPMHIAQQIGNQDVINIIQNAIDKKYGKGIYKKMYENIYENIID